MRNKNIKPKNVTSLYKTQLTAPAAIIFGWPADSASLAPASTTLQQGNVTAWFKTVCQMALCIIQLYCVHLAFVLLSTTRINHAEAVD